MCSNICVIAYLDVQGTFTDFYAVSFIVTCCKISVQMILGFFFKFYFIFTLDGVQTTHAFWAKVYLCSQSFSFPPATTGISETCSLNLCNSSSVFLVLIVEPEVSHISFFKMERGNPEYCVRHKCFKVSRFLFSLLCFKCLFAFFTFVITNEWHLLIRYFS